ncbi:hypothetical protein ACFL52_05305 [Candidatus Margulisiibacteriota bacterium]
MNKLLNEALDFPEIFARRKKKKIIIAIDEFGELVNWNGNLLKKMRAKFQKQDLTTYIFTGSQETLIKKLFTGKAEAFYGFAKVIGLGPLESKDLVDYLIRNYKKAKIKISKEIAEKLAAKTNFHPHYTKILAQSVYNVAAGQTNSVEEKEVNEGFERAFMYIKGEIDKDWASLSKAPLQKRVLKFLGLNGISIYSKSNFPDIDKSQIYLALNELEQKGLITKIEKASYQFINPFFPHYIQLLDRGND